MFTCAASPHAVSLRVAVLCKARARALGLAAKGNHSAKQVFSLIFVSFLMEANYCSLLDLGMGEIGGGHFIHPWLWGPVLQGQGQGPGELP